MKVNCPNCAQKYDVDESLFGVELECQFCGCAMRFDAPDSPVPCEATEAMKVYCPHCNQKYEIDESHFGLEIECQACEETMRFDAPNAPASPPPLPLEAVEAVGTSDEGKIRVSASEMRQRQTKVPAKRQGRSMLLPIIVTLALLCAALFFGYKQFADRPGTDVAATLVTSSTEVNVSAEQRHSTAAFTGTAMPFFETHCIRCHGPEKEKGSLRLDLLSADLDDHYNLSHYQNIIDELATQNMPPEDEPQPDAQDVVAVINALTELVEAAKGRHSSGGGRSVRRLTRTEFINTVWDQLGVHTDEEGLPDDVLVGSFDTNADALFMTDMPSKRIYRRPGAS